MNINTNMPVSDVKKYVQGFNKEFFRKEKERDEIHEIIKKMNDIKKSNLLNKTFAESLESEVKSLEEKMDFQVVHYIDYFAEVAHYVWNHPNKEDLLIVDSNMQQGYSGQETVYSFSGELGWILTEATKPANEFGMIWFVDFNNQKKELKNTSSWKSFCGFFLKSFCDGSDSDDFKKGFEKVKT